MNERKAKRGRKTAVFDAEQCDLLETYLTHYHYLATKASFDSREAITKYNNISKILEKRITKSFEYDTIWIAGHLFPALTQENVKKPYLAMPSTLGTKERRTLYQVCIYVGLYHTGAGKKDQQRYAVISIHANGFDHVPDLEEPIELPVLRCTQWYFRNSFDQPLTCDSSDGNGSFDDIKFTTEKMKSIIKEYATYPYKCIRDDIDTWETIMNPLHFESDYSTTLVDSGAKMRYCLKQLNSEHITELSFDIEAHNPSKFKQITCLLQLSTNLNHNYVIDVLASGVWNLVSELRFIFSNPRVVKIGHGISGIDVPCLQRDFGIFIVNAFDTLEAATRLKLKHNLGLAKLCQYYHLTPKVDHERHVYLKEKFQNCDWRHRPLNEEMIEYGTLDVLYLSKLRHILIRDLIRNDTAISFTSFNSHSLKNHVAFLSENLKNNELSFDKNVDDYLSKFGRCSSLEKIEERTSVLNQSEIVVSCFENAFDDNLLKSRTYNKKPVQLRYLPSLMETLAGSQHQCLRLWNEKKEPPEKNDNLLAILRRAERLHDTKRIKWNSTDMSLYYDLVEWRESVSKKIGIMPSMVCSLDFLVFVAYQRPHSMDCLKRISYILPFLLREKTELLVDLLLLVTKKSDGEIIHMKKGNRIHTEPSQKSTKDILLVILVAVATFAMLITNTTLNGRKK